MKSRYPLHSFKNYRQFGAFVRYKLSTLSADFILVDLLPGIHILKVCNSYYLTSGVLHHACDLADHRFVFTSQTLRAWHLDLVNLEVITEIGVADLQCVFLEY